MAVLRLWLRRYKPRPTDFLHCTIQVKFMSHSVAAVSGGSVAASNGSDAPVKAGFWSLTLGTIGVVYGDIGTSPLYALREAVLAATASDPTPSETVVFGILSLI